MYSPKEILTEAGHEQYLAHLTNIKNGLFYIENHRDDFHIGALNEKQDDDWRLIYDTFNKMLPLLKNGDGEKDE